MRFLSQVLPSVTVPEKQAYIKQHVTNRPGSAPVRLHLTGAHLDLALGPEFWDPHSSELAKKYAPSV